MAFPALDSFTHPPTAVICTPGNPVPVHIAPRTFSHSCPVHIVSRTFRNPPVRTPAHCLRPLVSTVPDDSVRTSDMSVLIPSSVIPYSHTPVIPVDLRSFISPVIVAIGFAHCGIYPSVIIAVRGIVSITHRVVVAPVRRSKYLAVGYGRPDKEPVIRSVYIMPVIEIDISGAIIIVTQVVIEYPQTANTPHYTVPIPDIDSSDLTNPTVVIIVNRNILYLDNRTVVVILNIGIVVESGVKCDAAVAKAYIGPNVNPIINVEIKFSVRID